MQNQNSFIRNQQLYNGKLNRNKIGPTNLSQFPQLGHNTVESVRDTLIRAKQTTGKKEETKPLESIQPKNPSELERYRRIQSMYNTRINK